MTDSHDEKETLKVDVCIPQHEDRVTTALFCHTRDALIAREGGRCWVCGRTGDEAGKPLEAHHHPIERSMAEMIDWPAFAADCKAGAWGKYPQGFDWDAFLAKGDIYAFADDMTVNGLLLCRDHHTVGDSGIHTLPYPLFVAQKYGKDGYQFSPTEVLHHEAAE